MFVISQREESATNQLVNLVRDPCRGGSNDVITDKVIRLVDS